MTATALTADTVPDPRNLRGELEIWRARSRRANARVAELESGIAAALASHAVPNRDGPACRCIGCLALRPLLDGSTHVPRGGRPRKIVDTEAVYRVPRRRNASNAWYEEDATDTPGAAKD